MARPARRFQSFVGQTNAVDLLKAQVFGAKSKGKIPVPLLIVGRQGSGRQTLAAALATEIGAPFVPVVTGPEARGAQLTKTIAKLPAGSVVFLGNLDYLRKAAQVTLARAIDDGVADLSADDGEHNLLPIADSAALIASVDEVGELDDSLRHIFTPVDFRPYAINEMRAIIELIAKEEDAEFTPQAIGAVARASSGLPRTALNLVRTIWCSSQNGRVTERIARRALETLGVDENGLWYKDRACLCALYEGGGELPIDVLSVMANVDITTIRNEVDHALIQRSLITVSGAKRVLTSEGIRLAEELNRENPDAVEEGTGAQTVISLCR